MATTKQLHPRSIELLKLVNDATRWEGDERPGKVLAHFFVPSAHPMWSETLGCHSSVSGSDGARLRALERRGLIERRERNATGSKSYWYLITEDGIALLATIQATEEAVA